jgi:nucleoside 2-deoxyribosyltransferase
MLRKIRKPIVYPAGPEVFNTTRDDVAYCTAWADRHGFDVPHPGRNPTWPLPKLYDQCIDDSSRADVIILDLNSFRGTEPDSGTSVELGIALNSGAVLLGHKDSKEDPIDRIDGNKPGPNGLHCDPKGYFIEPHSDRNLMLSESIRRNGAMFYGPRDEVFEQMARYIKQHVVNHYKHQDRLIGPKLLKPGTTEICETITPGFSVDLTRWAPIIDHQYTRRMREIKQLGALFWLFPDATHTRYGHEIMTYKFTHDELQHFNFLAPINRAILAYALIHDHGHTPYSHELEEIVQFDQMDAARQLFNDESFADAVASCDVDLGLLMKFFDKRNPHPLRAIVSDKVLGTDKLAYLLRDGIATGKGGYDNVEVLLNATVFEQGILGIDENNAMSAQKQIDLYHSTYMDTYFRSEARLSQRIFTLLGQIALEEKTLPDDWHMRNDLWYDFFNILAEREGHERLKKLGAQGIVVNAYGCVAALRKPGAEILEPLNGNKLIGSISVEDYRHFLTTVPARQLKDLEERLCKELGVEPLDILVAPGGKLSKLRVDDTYVFRNSGAAPVRLLGDMYPESKTRLDVMSERQAVSVRFFCRKEVKEKVQGNAEKLVAAFRKFTAP